MSTTSAAEGKSAPDTVEAVGGESSSGNIRRLQIRDGSSDGLAGTIRQLVAGGFSYLFNGSSWDRERSNEEVTVLASSSGSTNRTSSDQTNHNAGGVLVFVNATLGGTTPSFDAHVEIKDPQSGTYRSILDDTGISSDGLRVYAINPGATAGTGVDASADVGLPRTWRVKLDNFDTADGDETYTTEVGASYTSA